MRRACLALFLAAAPAAADVSRPSAGTNDFFPVHPGWRYLFKYEDGQTAEMVVGESTRFGKETCVPLKFSEFFQQGETTQFVKSGREGVAIHGFGQSEIKLRLDPPLPLLRRAPRPGDSWGYTGTYVMEFGGEAQRLAVKASVRVGARETLTAAGRPQSAAPITIELEAMSDQVRLTYWLAPGTGIVRMKAEGGGFSGTLTLTEIRR